MRQVVLSPSPRAERGYRQAGEWSSVRYYPDPGTWQTPARLWANFRPLAREARHNPTPAEARLWQAVRNRQLELQFRRQHSIGQFRVDFYCPAARLVVELDGSSHNDTVEYDVARTVYLEARNIRVVRFNNADVMRRLPWVVRVISDAIA